ncbi:MAG: YggS family pyridoxal phosphate-dependent enzyme [Deltaproteobacteria bacterium]
MNDIKENIASVRQIISETAKKIGKNPQDIRLIAVSKLQPIEKIKLAMDAGISYLGENHVQEFLKKWEILGNAAKWIFIGHLQTNKVKYLTDTISEIQTLDSLKLSTKLQQELQKKNRRLPVLIQINIGEETTKSGLFPKNLIPFLNEILRLFEPQNDIFKPQPQNDILEQSPPRMTYLDIQGLMAIPPYFKDPEKSRPYFRKMRELLLETQKAFPNLSLRELSMGMTHDFKIAIEEGATQVRVGEGIFGKRR